MFDQGDVDGEVGALLDELLGAVERVDQEEARAQRRVPVASGLLGDDWNVGGERLERWQNDGFGVPIGGGHGRRVALELDRFVLAVMRHDGGAGLGGGIGQKGGGAGEVERRSPRWQSRLSRLCVLGLTRQNAL